MRLALTLYGLTATSGAMGAEAAEAQVHAVFGALCHNVMGVAKESFD
jgi:hypothetical protein